ncbi:hypothetical protein GOP47_0015832 [Adiantum capillus-veneris]|uniref:Uncharacterized protein n=1 Tax=Adiantum capillus-veneris TaxID=13818 RepID=A0A9D4UKG7_ADICA|nr:hypothetical protein GOP47_0015832 [Adiantum capillus-veneris]
MTGHAKRILDWFEKFSSSQRREKETGAQALARFAFVNREKYWNELEWKGTHGQAPATLASKPHYFLDLDVLKTVENFLDYVPEFWSSNELWDSLKDGDLLSLDIDFFVRKLLEKMEDQSSLVWKLLEKFFWEEDFTHLCHRLLSFLEDQKLLQLINELSQGVAHASVTEGRKRDEENVKDSSSLISSLREMTNSTQQKHRAFWKDCLCWNKWELVKGLALESWAIQVLVLKEAHSTLSLKAFLSANSIQFRQASWERKDARVEKMRKRRRKKRRRTAHASSDEESNSLESDIATSDRGLGDNNGRWYLSTDNFNMGMEKDEIPEQLANFAFMKWLNWVASHG